MQERRPMAFESKKLSDVERRWPIHEKEMWAVVHCLKLWQHYLGLEYTKVYTNNVSVRYFETQPKITPKQWRWADVLACFCETLERSHGLLRGIRQSDYGN